MAVDRIVFDVIHVNPDRFFGMHERCKLILPRYFLDYKKTTV